MKTATIRLVLVLAVGIAAVAQTGRVPELRCELRQSEDGERNHGGVSVQSPKQRTHLHFILVSNRRGLKVYEDWNSWGYYARSFTAKDGQSKTYEITRRLSEWDKNYPSWDSLNKGEFLITDVFLCDGTWRVTPKLTFSPKANPIVKLQLAGRFTMQADKENWLGDADVWTGRIESAPVEVEVDEPCVDALNSEHGR